MKVLMVNGSPHEEGCTYTALEEVAKALEKAGVETEIMWLGVDAIAGCIGCGACAKTGKGCFRGDVVNEFIEKAKECETTLEFASENWQVTRDDKNVYRLENKNGVVFAPVQADLKGLYQRKNIPAVLETILTLRNNGLHISDQNVYDGIANTIRNTGLLGRWQELSQAPYTVCDTGHNIDGLTEIVAQLKTCTYEKLHFVIGMVNDKDVDSVLHILPKDAIYYFCKASIPRAMDEKILAEKARANHLHGTTFPTVAPAYQAARDAAGERDMIYIGGSTFVVAEVI